MSLLLKIRRYFHTLKHLKPTQVFYRVKYALIPVYKLKRFSFNGSVNHNLILLPHPQEKRIVTINEKFISIELLNRKKEFHKKIDWTFNGYGRLWNYNLQYADFLRQRDLSVSIRESFIRDLFSCLHNGKLQPEPYPASLRVMNTTRFLIHNFDSIQNTKTIINGLASELQFISKRLEYHLMGNHLLENGFALLMGGVYLNCKKWRLKAEQLLMQELEEQILNDGAHFERSVMYHQLMLFRVLEAISYMPKESALTDYLLSIASKMISWSKVMAFNDNSAAHFNDSVEEQTYSADYLINLALALNSDTNLKLSLSDSGFRKLSSASAELIIDTGGIKPKYQPGHAHADSLSFILNLKGSPFIVDPAISTYNIGEQRNWERSTKAHNTVTVDDENSADVWGSFRVGRRPVVQILNESKNKLTAEALYKTNNGLTVRHTRGISLESNKILIKDDVICKKRPIGRFYLYPETRIIKITDTSVEFANGILLLFSKVIKVDTFKYSYNKGFNRQIESSGIEYLFTDSCVIEIKIV